MDSSSLSSLGSFNYPSFTTKLEHPDRKQAEKLPFPPRLRERLPDQNVPWKINEKLFKDLQFPPSSTSEKYHQVELTSSDPETAFVYLLFNHSRPRNLSIRKIYCIHNRDLTKLFESNLPVMETQADQAHFAPDLDKETDSALRKHTLKRWKSAVDLFSPFWREIDKRQSQKSTKTFLLPLWHGTKRKICESIAETGFAPSGKHQAQGDVIQDGISTDVGYFGSGIYFTNSARYCSKYSQESLLLSWVSMREPFPVVADHAATSPQDEPKDKTMLKGKEGYKRYNAHYIPVLKVGSGESAVYYPCAEGQKPRWDEIVVFNPAQTLPRFLVELTSSPSPYSFLSPSSSSSSSSSSTSSLSTSSSSPLSSRSHSSSSASQTVGSLLDKLYEVLENPSIKQQKELCSLLESYANTLVDQEANKPLSSEHTALYNLTSRLLDKDGKIRRTVAQRLLLKKSSSIDASLDEGVDLPISSSSSTSSSHSISSSASSTHPTVGLLRDKLDAVLKSQHLEKTYPKLKLQLNSYAKKLGDKYSDALLFEEEIRLYTLITRLLGSGGINVDVANTLFKEKLLYPVPPKNHNPTSLKGHTNSVWCLAQLSDGRIASASGDGTIRIWPLDGSPPTILNGHTSYALAQLADGRLASGSIDGTVRIWPLEGSPLTILKGHANEVNCLAQLADGRIASGAMDHTVRIWPLDGSSPTVLNGHTGPVYCLAQLADGRLASGSLDRTIRIWPLDGSPPTILKWHDPVRCLIRLADGRLASGCDYGTIQIWPLDGSPPTVLRRQPSGVSCLTQLADGRIASGAMDHTVRIWPLDGSSPTVLKGHTEMVFCLAQLADGRLASASGDGTIRIWEKNDLLQGKSSTCLIA